MRYGLLLEIIYEASKRAPKKNNVSRRAVRYARTAIRTKYPNREWLWLKNLADSKKH